MYSLNEIFYSIQGEGCHTGRPGTFIRLSGCSLACEWCDTDHSVKRKMEAEDIASEALILQPVKSKIFHSNGIDHKPFAVITGGEPTIHELRPLAAALKALGFYVAVESNGTGDKRLIKLRREGLVDWITISPKPTFDYFSDHLYNIEECDEIKIVFDGVIDPNSFVPYIRKQISTQRAYIQPCSCNYEPAIKFVETYPFWRLSTQIQKVINIR